jgi:hypothetical protein
LKDLAWEETLYRRVQQIIERRGDATLHDQDDRNEDQGNLPFQDNKVVANGRGASWIIEGDDFFREVTVSDLALIVVRGIWARHELPQNGLRIRELFKDVLDELKLEARPTTKDQEPGV